MSASASQPGVPDRIKLYFCPDCGALLNGKTINLDPGRKKCSKLWHKAAAVKADYGRLNTPERA